MPTTSSSIWARTAGAASRVQPTSTTIRMPVKLLAVVFDFFMMNEETAQSRSRGGVAAICIVTLLVEGSCWLKWAIRVEQ